VSRINKLGGLHAIVISHPHFYSSHLEWAERFDCQVYLAGEDKKWLARRSDRQAFLEEGIGEMEVKVGGVDVGVRVVKLGGHFPGSCRLLFGFPFFFTPAIRRDKEWVGD
jgi:glyoxylase-like metal-dependent hydrolase (beta-lactamase superfamily II)